jgi:DNA-binding LytR/AlgR family response regulator
MDPIIELSCYVLDDEQHAIEVLKAFIERTPGLHLKGATTDPLLALTEVTSATPPDICFADVDMPRLSGMEFAGMVSIHTRVIFTTSYPEYAVEAFEKNAFDYLLKPIGYERFLKAIMKIRKHMLETKGRDSGDGDFIFVRTDIKGKVVKIVISEIIYIEAKQNYIRIVATGANYMTYLTMEEIEADLPKASFMRVHRSFIINTARIRSMEHGQVTLDHQSVIPLGRVYKDQLVTLMKGRLIQSARKGGT